MSTTCTFSPGVAAQPQVPLQVQVQVWVQVQTDCAPWPLPLRPLASFPLSIPVQTLSQLFYQEPNLAG